MSITSLVLVVLTVFTAAHEDTNVVFKDSPPKLDEKRVDQPSEPEATHYPMSNGNPFDEIQETLVLGLYNATLNLDRTMTSLNAVDHESDRNVIVSPACVLAAVSLMLLGASGPTKTELGKLFGFNEHLLSDSTDEGDGEKFKKLGMLLNDYPDSGDAPDGAHASLAKAVFAQNNRQPLAIQYKAAIREYLNSEVVNVDFSSNALEAQRIINGWVSNHTRGKITDIVQNTPPPDTKIVIASALYFAGEWENPFFVNYTRRKPFHFESHGDNRMNNIIYVSMMIGVSEIFYHNNEELQFKAIGLPYKGNDYVAYFVLPNENISMRDLMNTINERTLRNITKSTILAEVTYFVPKMTLKSFTNLKPVLQNMKINSVFDPSKANLSKMGLGQESYISDILHKVEIVVDEIGTVASAATVVTVTRGGQPIFNVNRPFLFFIHHSLSDTILFWTSINKPTPYSTTSSSFH